MKGDPSGDIRLQSGDVLFVPNLTGVAYVRGEVRRPAIYELVGGETLAELITMAGGFTVDAFPMQTTLVRRSLKGKLRSAVSIDLTSQDSLDSLLTNGDSLQIPKVGDDLSGSVLLTGAVYRPGNYGWKKGMRVSDLIGDADRDLMSVADLNYALIVREKNTLRDIRVLQFRLMDSLLTPGTDGDPIVNEADEILVFSVPELLTTAVADDDVDTGSEFAREKLLKPVLEKLRAQARDGEPSSIAGVGGAVKAPGAYPIFANSNANDLLRAAGGMLESADLTGAELRRLELHSDGNLAAVYLRLEFNETGKIDNPPEIMSRDFLKVRRIPDWNPDDSVTIEGEVMFPGTYLITNDDTVSSVIARAGGLSAGAFPEGAVFTRESVAEQEAAAARAFASEIRRNYAASMLTEESKARDMQELLYVTEELERSPGTGRIYINLIAALNGEDAADYDLQDGDVLNIPTIAPQLLLVVKLGGAALTDTALI